MAETEKRILLLESRIVGAEQLAFLAEMFNKVGKGVDEASLKLPKLEAANNAALKSVEAFSKQLNRQELALAALPAEIELLRRQMAQLGDDPRKVDAYTKRINELETQLEEANSAMTTTAGSFAKIGSAAQVADSTFDKMVSSARAAAAATEGLPVALQRARDEMAAMEAAGQANTGMYRFLTAEVDKLERKLQEYNAQLSGTVGASAGLDAMGKDVADTFARMEKSISTAEAEMANLPSLIQKIEMEMLGLAAAGKEGTLEFARWQKYLADSKGTLAGYEASLQGAAGALDNMSPAAKAAADIMGKIATDMQKVETEAKAIPLALAQVTKQMEAMRVAGTAVGPVFDQLVRSRDKLLARQGELEGGIIPTGNVDDAAREMANFAKSVDAAVRAAEQLGDKAKLLQDRMNALEADGKQGTATYQALAKEMRAVQKAQSSLAASAGQLPLDKLADDAMAAEKSMQGWRDALKQSEAVLGTLGPKIAEVKARIAELEATGKRGSAAWVAYKTELVRLTDAQTKFDVAAKGNVNSMKDMRYQMQNVSYQVTDMVVQLQSGTSAFVVMAQQGPQLLAGFGAAGAAAGVAVAALGAVAGPVAAAFGTLSATLDTVNAKLDTLDSTIGMIGKTTDSIDLTNFAKKYIVAGALGQQAMQGLFRSQVFGARLAVDEAIRELDRLIDKFKTVTWWQDKLSMATRFSAKAFGPLLQAADDMTDKFLGGNKQLKEFNQSVQILGQRTYADAANVKRLGDAMDELGVTNTELDRTLIKSGRTMEDRPRVMQLIVNEAEKLQKLEKDLASGKVISDDEFLVKSKVIQDKRNLLSALGVDIKALKPGIDLIERYGQLRMPEIFSQMGGPEFEKAMAALAGGKDKGKDAQRNYDQASAYLTLLSKLTLELDKSADSLSEYKKLQLQNAAALDKLDPKQKAHIDGLMREVATKREALEVQNKWLKGYFDQEERQKGADEALNRIINSQRNQAEALKDTLDPMRQLNRVSDDYKMLLDNEFISLKEYDELMIKHAETIRKTVPSMENAFSLLAEDSLGKFFENVGKSEFKFKEFANSFISDVLRMIAKMETMRFLYEAFGWGSKPQGKGLWDIISGLLPGAGGGGDWGPQPEAAGLRMPGVALLESAPTKSVYSRIAIPADEGRAGRDKPSMNVQVINNTPAEIKTEQREDGSVRILVNQVKQSIMGDISRGGNAMSRTFESSYALGRATR